MFLDKNYFELIFSPESFLARGGGGKAAPLWLCVFTVPVLLIITSFQLYRGKPNAENYLGAYGVIILGYLFCSILIELPLNLHSGALLTFNFPLFQSKIFLVMHAVFALIVFIPIFKRRFFK